MIFKFIHKDEVVESKKMIFNRRIIDVLLDNTHESIKKWISEPNLSQYPARTALRIHQLIDWLHAKVKLYIYSLAVLNEIWHTHIHTCIQQKREALARNNFIEDYVYPILHTYMYCENVFPHILAYYAICSRAAFFLRLRQCQSNLIMSVL